MIGTKGPARTFACGLVLSAVALAGRSQDGPRPLAAADLEEAWQRTAVWSSSDIPTPPDAFRQPRGIVVDLFDASVFVVDGGNQRVQVFAADGGFRQTIGGQAGAPDGLNDPEDIAVSGARAYVTEPEMGRVRLFSLDGALRGDWIDLARPWGIVAADDGRVFVVENDASRVAVFRADGTRLGTWGGFGELSGLNRPRGVAIAPSGHLIVADTGNRRVVAYDLADGAVAFTSPPTQAAPIDVAAGTGVDVWIAYDDGRVARHEDRDGLPQVGAVLDVPGAAGVALAPDGSMLVTFQDDLRPLHGFRRYEGRTLVAEQGDVPSPLGLIDGPLRIAAASEAFVADRWRRAQVFAADGTPIDQIAAGGINDLAVAPDGGIFVVRDASVARMARDGTTVWEDRFTPQGGDFPWAVATDYAARGDQLVVLDLGRQRLLTFRADGTAALGPSIRPAPGASAALWDVAIDRLSGDLLTVNRAAGALEVRDPTTSAVRTAWAVPGEPMRVAAGPNGHAFVLNRHGWVLKLAADGRIIAAWRAGDPADEASAPSDLTVDNLGRVLVTDAGRGAVEVWEPDPGGTPGVLPDFEPACQPIGSKVAAPGRVTLGETITVTLSVAGTCPPTRTRADIVLVIDVSGSMIGPNIDAAKAAALAFVDAIDVAESRVAVVSFNQDALLEQPLTANPVNLEVAIDRLQAGGGTDIAVALDAARRELTGPRRRPSANSVIVLLTDGGSAEPPAVRAAELAKLEGARLFTVGFGGGVNAPLLERLASAPADYYFAPDPGDLAAIYRQIAQRIAASVLFTALQMVDEIPANMRYVPGSAMPPAVLDGARLIWTLSDVPLAGIALTYRLDPLELGVHPTNVVAAGEGTDGLGHRGRVPFPVPIVEVVAPIPTPTLVPGVTPTATPSARPSDTPSTTPTPTREPAAIYLPVLRNERCPKRTAPVDVILVLDTSSSMADATRAGRSKLEAAIDAARLLIGKLDLARDAAAIVSFDAGGRVAVPFGQDRGALIAALADLRHGSGTRIDLGLDRAAELLEQRGPAPERATAVLILTDGQPTGTTHEAVLAAGRRVAAAADAVFAIGLGDDAAASLLSELASGQGRAIVAPDGEDLAGIYREIARELPCLGE